MMARSERITARLCLPSIERSRVRRRTRRRHGRGTYVGAGDARAGHAGCRTPGDHEMTPHARKGIDTMDLKGKLRKGLKIFGADNREYGTIDRYDDQYAYVGERRIPVSAFERMDNDRLYLGAQGGRYFADTAEAWDDPKQIRVPVQEERLEVEKRQAEMGSVDIRKTVETEQVNVPVELRHEEVTVDRVDVPDRPVAAGAVADAFEEGTIRVPVR